MTEIIEQPMSLLIATQEGDIPVSQELLNSAVLLDTGRPHPTCTLADYFSSVANFFFQWATQGLLPEQCQAMLSTKQSKISIVSDKIGALYHVARIQISNGQTALNLAMNSALSEAGKSCLFNDYQMLTNLQSTCSGPFLPRPYAFTGGSDSPCPQDTFSHMLVEWFDDFHEWHCTHSPDTRRPRISLWDRKKGSVLLNADQTYQIYYSAAAILTGLFNFESRYAVWDWHHAAGDFIVRHRGANIDIRLITVRNLRPSPFRPVSEKSQTPPLIFDLLLFLVDLSFRMRLDKLDGVGETVWLGEDAVEAVLSGFFATLDQRTAEIPHHGLLGLQLKAFFGNLSKEDMATICRPVLDGYGELLSAADQTMITSQHEEHLHALHRHFGSFRVS